LSEVELLKVTILGSGTAVPSLKRNSAGVLIQSDGFNYLIDFGYGNLRQLLNLGLTYHDIDRIFFTHNHPDHMCDLIIFLFSSRYHLNPRIKDLTIIGGPGFGDFFNKVTDAFGHWLVPTSYKIDIMEMDEETKEWDKIKVQTLKTKHIEMSRGYRFIDSNGKSTAISGDTDYSENMVVLGKNSNLMILECSFPDEMKSGGHLTPTLAGKMANESNCAKLCLTHFYPPCELDAVRKACEKEFPGELFLAEDLMEFNL